MPDQAARPAQRRTPPPPPGDVLRNADRRVWALRWGGALGAAMLGPWLAGATPAARAQLPTGDNPDGSEVWLALRETLFGDRPITPARPDTLVLEAPLRAVDAAVVPVAIRSRLPQTVQRHVRRLMLVIDSNPSPLGMMVWLTPESGRAEIETRVRVDAYSYVRAIAELNDGSLIMAVRYVKASGGCSAPAASDAQAALARLGQMRLQVEGVPVAGQPMAVQLQISHPNHSGMAMDQLTRQFTPAQFVRQVDVTLAGRPVLSAQVDFSISENPHLRFFVLPGPGGELLARMVDTDDLHASASATLSVPAR